MPKSKTRKQLAQEYGVSRRTFYRMLKQADLNPSPGLIKPADQKKIYEEFGHPTQVQSTRQKE